MIMTVQDVIDIYNENLKHFDFFSDPQGAFIDDEGYLGVCIGYYEWYKTKNKVEDAETALRAIFEIERLYWYVNDEEPDKILTMDYSYYWNRV